MNLEMEHNISVNAYKRNTVTVYLNGINLGSQNRTNFEFAYLSIEKNKTKGLSVKR